MVTQLESAVARLPGLGSLYARRSATIKRGICLLLHSLGLLRPFTFVQWLATYGCNLQCPYCEAAAGRVRMDELTTAEALSFIDDLHAMGAPRLLISGGEPLVRPDMGELLAQAHRRGLQIGLASNGFLVSELWEELGTHGLFLYFTSLDGTEDEHDRQRGRHGAYARALDGLARFAGRGVPTRIVNTVVHPGNLDLLSQLYPIVRDSGATRWHLSPVSNVGRAEGQSAYALNGEDLRRLLAFVRSRQRLGPLQVDLGESHTYLWLLEKGPVARPFFCGAGLTRCSIMPNGDVLGCQQVYDATFAEGNIRQQPLSYLWRQGFQRFRRSARPDACRACEHWDGCQGGCWAEQQTRVGCLKSDWTCSC